MALTEAEQRELDELQARYGSTSVLSPTYQPPSAARQFGQAALQSLPEVGGLLGGFLGAATTRTPLGAIEGRAAGMALGRGLLGTGLGTATGTATRQAVDAFMGRPQPIEKNLAEQLSNAATNVALDAGGNLIFNLAGKAYRVAKDKLPPIGIFGQAPAEQNLKAQVQRLLETEGGSLTRYQVEPGVVASVAESVGRAGVTGRPVFTKLEEANLRALKTARDAALNDVSSRAIADIDAGANYKDIISKGQDALSSAVKPFYENLATGAARPGVASAVSRMSGGAGLPVNTQGIAQSARDQLKRAEAISKTEDPSLSLGSEVVTELRKLSDIKDNISFAEAHDFRAKLGARLRAIRDEFGPNSPQVALLSKTIKDIEDAMDYAASNLNPALKAQYDETSKFYRDSINELFPKTLAKLNKTTAERLGETIFRTGNVSEVQDFYRSLDRAKKLNPDLDTSLVRQSIQRGYLSSLIGEEGGEVSVDSLLRLSKKLQEDKKFKRTFDAAIDPSIRNNVETLVNAARLSQAKPQNTFSLAINNEQADAVRGLVQGILATAGGSVAYNELGAAGAVLAGGGILLTPKALAKFATNKDAIKQMLSAEKAFRNVTSLPEEARKQAVLRTIALMNSAYDRAGVTPEDLAAPAAPAPAAAAAAPAAASQLSPQEEEELRALEERYK